MIERCGFGANSAGPDEMLCSAAFNIYGSTLFSFVLI